MKLKKPCSVAVGNTWLDIILKNHLRWLTTKGTEGERANIQGVRLDDVDLTGFELFGAIIGRKYK